jgi:KaiC/GvpD/RAD55 family RecA-like ATPase
MEEKIDVICPQCGGIIDEKTLKCKSCGKKYSREEYEELKNEILLKRWLLGDETSILDEDKEALEKWLEGDEEAFLGLMERKGRVEEAKEIEEKVKEAKKGAKKETVDVDKLIEENIKLKSLLEVEFSKREELEKEIEILKKQIEELKKEALESLPEDIKELKRKEMELREEIIKLESLKRKKMLETEAKGAATLVVSSKEIEEIKKAIKDGKVKELSEKVTELMKELAEKDKIINELKNELKIKEDEMKKFEEMLKYKEEELIRREEDLLYREKKMEAQMRQLQMMKEEIGDMDEIALKRRLEDLQEEIRRKEEELRAKENYLRAKERELEAKMKGLVEQEVELAEEEIKIEIKERKVKTGTRRLDDLLFGGFPLGSNILVYGPPYSKKEVLVYSFMAEGLRKGVPAIWILTDVTVDTIREEMAYVLPTYPQYEKMGLVYYIDAYSRSIGDKTEIEGVIYLESQTDVEGISKAVDEISAQIKEKSKYYRLAFRSLSTVMAYLDQQALLRFLQPFTTKRKRDNAVSLYLLEKGLHSENEIQMVGYSMDGMIEFKIEAHKTFLAVHGITEVQSRNWIEVSASKSGITLGSFTLGHIR